MCFFYCSGGLPLLLIALKYLWMMRKVRVQVHEVPKAGVQDGLAEPVQWEERAEEEEKHGGGTRGGEGGGAGGGGGGGGEQRSGGRSQRRKDQMENRSGIYRQQD